MEKAVCEELQGLLDIGAFDLRDVREWDDVIRENPRAKHANMRFVLGQKNAELNEERRRMKARMVVGGHNVRDASGQRCVDVLHHIVPVGMTSIRLCHAHAATYEDGTTREADIVQAYPKAPLGGDPVWGHFAQASDACRVGRNAEASDSAAAHSVRVAACRVRLRDVAARRTRVQGV